MRLVVLDGIGQPMGVYEDLAIWALSCSSQNGIKLVQVWGTIRVRNPHFYVRS
jgi:hypothetical protein